LFIYLKYLKKNVSLQEGAPGGRPVERSYQRQRHQPWTFGINRGLLMSKFTARGGSTPESWGGGGWGGRLFSKKIYKHKQKNVNTFTWRETPFAPPLEGRQESDYAN